MLRLTVSPEEYLMINDNIKIVFLGGTCLLYTSPSPRDA